VARPSSVDEVRAVVRWAIEHRVRLLPQGANTGLVGSSVPDESGEIVVLSTERLVAPLTIDPLEQVAHVGAGVRLGALNAAAAAHGLHLPIDLAADPSVGGMVSTNTGGSRVVRHGPLRAHVLDIGFVAADDDASWTPGGRHVRKDSRGVDLAHVLVGSGGALAVVTSATFALTPLPKRRSTWWIIPTPGSEVALFERLMGLGDLSAFELVSRAALAPLAEAAATTRLPFPLASVADAMVLAEWSTSSDTDDALDRVAELLAAVSSGAEALVVDAVEVPVAAAWSVRHAVSDSLRTAGVVVGHDVAVPRGAIAALRSAARAVVEQICPRAVLCDFGHAGDGGMHLNVVFPHSLEPPTPAERAQLREAFDALVARDGTYSAEHGLGPLNADTWLASTSTIEQAVIASLKDALDPHHLLGHPGHPYNRVGRP
jgi:FAD/FMN-containing dehydrogenase